MSKRTAVYNNTSLEITNPDLSLEEIKKTFVGFYSELKDAEVYQEGDVVKFRVKSGTKGSDEAKRFAVYGSTAIEIMPGVSKESVFNVMKGSFSELKDADVKEVVTERGLEYQFQVKSGTKGN